MTTTGNNNSSLINEDLAPVPFEKRKWGTWNYAALWISMSLCIPTYTMASSMINNGMNWWQAILTIFLGQCDCSCPDAVERTRRGEIWNSLSRFCKSKFWNKRR